MKSITTHITEKLQLNHNRTKMYEYTPETREDLQQIISNITKQHKNDEVIDLNMIDTSKITDMSYLFYTLQYNFDISQWNVSNVTDMESIFESSKFNNDISTWNVSNVTNMNNMFADSIFDQNISSWDVSNVHDMSYMFYKSEFNQDISDWNVSNVRDMSHMFMNSKFNQDISRWDVSNVRDMSGMFNSCHEFTGKGIGKWDVSNVQNMHTMFRNAFKFNDDISSWKLNKKVNLRFILSVNIYDKNNNKRIRETSKLAFNHDLTPWVQRIDQAQIKYIENFIKK